MALEAVQFLPAGDVPQTHRVIVAAREEATAIPGKGKTADGARVALETMLELPIVQVPETETCAPGGERHLPPLVREGRAADHIPDRPETLLLPAPAGHGPIAGDRLRKLVPLPF